MNLVFDDFDLDFDEKRACNWDIDTGSLLQLYPVGAPVLVESEKAMGFVQFIVSRLDIFAFALCQFTRNEFQQT